MRITKLLSVFLAVLMLLSCVAGALATGVAAEETGSEGDDVVETITPSYTDPRDVEGAEIITYYAGAAANFPEGIPEGATASGSILAALTNNAYTGNAGPYKNGTWPDNAVLVIKVAGEHIAYHNSDSNFVSTNFSRCKNLLFAAPTIKTVSGYQLPIVIEGVEGGNANLTFTGETVVVNCANDYFITGVNFQRKNANSAGTDKDCFFYAGSGEVVLENITFTEKDAEEFLFSADCTTPDAFYAWTDATVESNQDANGKVKSSLTIGKGVKLTAANSAYNIATKPALAVVRYNASSGTTAYTNTWLADSDTAGLTDDIISSATTAAQALRPSNGTRVTTANNAKVKPYQMAAKVVIDTCNTGDEVDVPFITVRAGYSPADATLEIVSGVVGSVTGAVNTINTSKREVYVGDTTYTISGGKITGTAALTPTKAYFFGDVTLNVSGGTITTINGSDGASVVTGAITGEYVANISGGNITTYRGGTCIYGEGKVTNNVSGGTFNLYVGLRFNTNHLVNNITGGEFKGAAYGAAQSASSAAYVGQTVVNTIGAENMEDLYLNYFYGASGTSSYKWESVTTTVVGSGSFGGFPATNGGNTTTLTINSTSADDVLRFRTATYNIDSVSMNGGIIEFAASESFNFTAQAATGSATIRNYTEFADDAVKFTFVGADGSFELTPAYIESEEITTMPKVVAADGNLTIVKDIIYVAPTTVAPAGATLIMDPTNTAVGVRFLFDIEEVEAIDGFTYDVLLNGTSIVDTTADLEEYEGQYSIVTYGIGLNDMNTELTFGGSIETETEFSLATIVELAADQFTGDWGTWAAALENLNNVHNLGLEGTNGGELDKAYEEYTLNQGNLIADLAGLKAEFTMSNVTGIRFIATFNTMPETLVVMVNGSDMTDIAVVENNTVTIDLALAAQNMEENIAIKVKDYTNNTADYYFEFIGSAAQLAQTVAGTDAAAAAFLWYIQAAAALVA